MGSLKQLEGLRGGGARWCCILGAEDPGFQLQGAAGLNNCLGAGRGKWLLGAPWFKKSPAMTST